MGAGQRGHGCIEGHEPQLDGFIAPFLAQDIPAFVVFALVFVNEFLRGLNRNVIGLKRNIGKERFV